MATMIQSVKKMVDELLTRASDGRLAREVEKSRNGPEALSARERRKAATAPWALADDEEVRLARRLLDEISEQLGRCAGDDTAPKALVVDVANAFRAAATWVDAAQRETEMWIKAARRGGLDDIDRELIALSKTMRRVSDKRAQHIEETIRLAGRRDDAEREHPFPEVARWHEKIARAEKQLSGPPAKRPAPGPRAGEVRVRVLVDRIIDRAWNAHRLKGDVFDVEEKEARRLLREAAVEVVEAGKGA